MENQVEELKQRNKKAAPLHSELPTYQRRATLQALGKQQLRKTKIKIIIFISRNFIKFPSVGKIISSPIQINGLILEEAHCLV
jgi:ATP-dependent DNA helicase RecQ